MVFTGFQFCLWVLVLTVSIRLGLVWGVDGVVVFVGCFVDG